MALQHVTASRNSPAPLGAASATFCTPTSGCTALIDSQTFDIEMPPAVTAAMLTLLGVPANASLVRGGVTGRRLRGGRDAGYPARARSEPTIDFQIQARDRDRPACVCVIRMCAQREGQP